MKALHEFLKTLTTVEKKNLAKDVNTTTAYLYRIIYGKDNKKISGALAWKLDKASGGAVSKYDLRPDVFGEKPQKEATSE